MTENVMSSAEEIAAEIKDRRMIFTDKEWSNDTGTEFSEVYSFAYYTFAGMPVRVLHGNKYRWSAAEKLNYMTGQFDDNIEILISVKYDSSGDAEEISKEEFYKKCDEYMAYWTPEKIAEREIIRKKNEAWLRERIAMKEGKLDGK